MKTRRLGTSEVMIPPVVMGGWLIGRQHWAGVDDNESVRMLRAGFDAGLCAVDTAEVYGDGHSERIIAKALGSVRHEIVIMGKVFANHLHGDAVIRSCERSLKNLRTDYVDLFQVHWPSGSFGMKTVPVEETAGALAELVRQGKARAVGLCNTDEGECGAYGRFLRVDAVQAPYNLFWRHAEKGILPWCLENRACFLAYSPLAQGILAGRFGEHPLFAPGDHRESNRLFAPEIYPRATEAVKELSRLAARLGISLPLLSLAWALGRPGVSVIAGARTAEQVRENARAGELSLSPDVLGRVSEIGARVCGLLDDDPRPWFPPGKGEKGKGGE